MYTTSRRIVPFFTLSLSVVMAASCRQNNTIQPNNTENTPPQASQVKCPGETLTVCDLQLTTSPNHPSVDAPIELTDVLVTTPTIAVSIREGVVTVAGFYVQDTAIRDALEGRYSGVLVTYRPGQLAGTGVPSAGDVVTIDGAYAEFGRAGFPVQRQVRASRINASSERATITPVDITDVAKIGHGGSNRDAYEGVLVRIQTVTITNTTVKVNDSELFYSFEVENALIVAGDWYRYRSPQVGEAFSSITGILRLGTAPFNSGVHMLTPRFETDIVAQTSAPIVRSIRDIQDTTAPGHPAEGCVNVSGTTEGKCAIAKLKGVVVTAAGGYVSKNLRSMWIQDPTVAGGRFAGIKLVYNPSRVPFEAKPGDRINLEGEVIEYRGGTQIQYAELEFVESGEKISPVVVDEPSHIGRRSPRANDYEGVLVQVRDVAVEKHCIEDSKGRDHGNWIVTGEVMIGTAFQYDYNGDFRPSAIQCLDSNEEPTGDCGCETRTGGTSRPDDQRHIGDRFRSITGIVDQSFGDYQLQIRGDSDLDKI